MTSFGFSLGDIALVSTYAYDVYKSCKSAGESFAAVTADGKRQVQELRRVVLIFTA
jgi:hypothetical protein